MSSKKKKLMTGVSTSAEINVEQCIVTFTVYLPTFVDDLKKMKDEAAQLICNLSNLSEQLRHINKVSFSDGENFPEMESKLHFIVSICIEEELSSISKVIERLKNSYKDLKRKLMNLERSTLSIDWDRNSDLINGTATQPKLELLLDLCLTFLTSMDLICNEIDDAYIRLDVNTEKTVTRFCNSWKFTVDNENVNYLLALARIVNNKN